MNNVTHRDVNQISAAEHQELQNAKRVYIVGGEFKPEIKMDNLKLEPNIIIQKEYEKIEIPVIVKEIEIKEVEKTIVIHEPVLKEIQVPVVVKEAQIITVDKPVIIEKEIIKTIEIEKPIIVEKVKDLKVFLIINSLILLGLVVGMFIKH
jgi:hypothetical protein